MAKRKPKHTTQKSFTQNRDAVSIARRDRKRERRDFVSVQQDDFRRKLPSEDFFGPIERTVHDDKGKPVDIVSRPIEANRKESSQNNFRNNPTREVFAEIRNTVCQRRKERREVLFATRRTGKGGRQSRHLWTYFSNVLCRSK